MRLSESFQHKQIQILELILSVRPFQYYMAVIHINPLYNDSMNPLQQSFLTRAPNLHLVWLFFTPLLETVTLAAISKLTGIKTNSVLVYKKKTPVLRLGPCVLGTLSRI